MTGTKRRHAVGDRARRRAIRALAAQLGVPYSVAARLLAGPAADDHRAWLFAHREQRPFHARVRDTREAADLPLGRAAQLAARFPRLRTAAGPLFDGPGRRSALAMLYAVVVHGSPGLVPAAGELDWVAGLGEEAAVDITCAGLDRAARLLLDEDRWQLWTRVEAALAALAAGPDRRLRDAAVILGRDLRAMSLRGSLAGARHTLDAVLLQAYELCPPGTRVAGGTVVGARWPRTGPPTGYEVRPDGSEVVHFAPIDRGEPARS